MEKMLYVYGIDSDGNVYWMNHKEQWTADSDKAARWKESYAKEVFLSVIRRNRTLPREDQIEPFYQESIHG